MPRPRPNLPPVYPKNARPGQHTYARVYDGSGGHRNYPLGPAGSPQAAEAYARLLAELASGDHIREPTKTVSGPTVAEAVERFTDYARKRYTVGVEFANFQSALRVVLELYGSTPLAEFGAKQLKTVRGAFVARGWCLRTIRAQLGRVCRCWRWLESDGMAPAGSWASLKSVPGPDPGEAPVYEEVLPVPEADLAATLPWMSPTVRAAVLVQLHTGARPSEVLGLRPMDLQREGAVQLSRGVIVPLGGVWAAVLTRHKTARHGHKRILLFGPKAQEAVALFLERAADAHLFSSRESYLWHCAKRGIRPGNSGRDRYGASGYNRHVRNACRAAGVPPWHVYRLRHNAGTVLASEFGIEVARIVLGHRGVGTTQIYVAPDLAKAAEAIRRVG